MSEFSSDWLALREPVDRRSRSATILAAVEHHFAGRDSITAIDLASGRGSMIRALRPHLPPRQIWRAVDHEAVLLRDTGLDAGATINVEPCLTDLAVGIEAVLALDADLVVSSAFIDLVSGPWLDRLVAGIAAKSVPIYLALSYDGHVACEPHHPLDEAVIAAFARHQQGDKGFGPALGPAAGGEVARKLAAAGLDVICERADWHVTREERDLQHLMVQGWFAAARELQAIEPEALEQWRRQRIAWISEARAAMRVGHLDVWAVPR